MDSFHKDRLSHFGRADLFCFRHKKAPASYEKKLGQIGTILKQKADAKSHPNHHGGNQQRQTSRGDPREPAPGTRCHFTENTLLLKSNLASKCRLCHCIGAAHRRSPVNTGHAEHGKQPHHKSDQPQKERGILKAGYFGHSGQDPSGTKLQASKDQSHDQNLPTFFHKTSLLCK